MTIATQTLQEAIEADFDDLAQIKTDARLDCIRQSSAFKNIVQRLEKRRATKAAN